MAIYYPNKLIPSSLEGIADASAIVYSTKTVTDAEDGSSTEVIDKSVKDIIDEIKDGGAGNADNVIYKYKVIDGDKELTISSTVTKELDSLRAKTTDINGADIIYNTLTTGSTVEITSVTDQLNTLGKSVASINSSIGDVLKQSNNITTLEEEMTEAVEGAASSETKAKNSATEAATDATKAATAATTVTTKVNELTEVAKDLKSAFNADALFVVCSSDTYSSITKSDNTIYMIYD